MSPIDRLMRAIAARTPRERRMLLVAGTVVLLALLFSVSDWVWHERARLSRSLPDARNQLVRMQEQAAELLQLSRQPAPAATPLATLLEAARAAAASRGLRLAFEVSGDLVLAKGSGSFDTLADWLASMQAEQGLRAVRLTLAAQGADVAIDAALAPAVVPER